MRKLFVTALVLLPLFATAADRQPTASKTWVGVQPKIDVSVRAGSTAGTYQVHTVVSDRDSGKVLETPTMLIRAGAWAKADFGRTGVPGLAAVSLAVTVDPSGRHAAYFADFRRGSGNTDTQSGTLIVSK